MVTLLGITYTSCSREKDPEVSNIKIYGTVFSRSSHEPIQGVSVSILSRINSISGTSSTNTSTIFSTIGSTYTGSDGTYEINFTQLDAEYVQQSDGMGWTRYGYEHKVTASDGWTTSEKKIQLSDGSYNVDFVL